MLVFENCWSSDACLNRWLKVRCICHMSSILILRGRVNMRDLLLHLSMTHINLLVLYLGHHLPEHPIQTLPQVSDSSLMLAIIYRMLILIISIFTVYDLD